MSAVYLRKERKFSAMCYGVTVSAFDDFQCESSVKEFSVKNFSIKQTSVKNFQRERISFLRIHVDLFLRNACTDRNTEYDDRLLMHV